MRYVRPLPDPHAPADALPLAGGWTRFTHVEVLERGRKPLIIPASEVPEDQLAQLTAPRAPITGISMARPSLMGVLNVTPDSFSDGGRYDTVAAAVAQADRMADADVLDIGGESTRPGAVEVPVEDEIARIAPVLDRLGTRVTSVDTRKAAVASAALARGADIINDVSALTFDQDMAGVVASSTAWLCLMHAQGLPDTMQNDPRYGDVVLDVYDALADRVATAEAAGIARDRIFIDPGIGFGKTRDHNIALLKRLSLFHGLGLPILLGVSRKRFIGEIGGAEVADTRAPGTLAVTLHAVAQGIQMHRVHDVNEIAQGLKLWRAVTEES